MNLIAATSARNGQFLWLKFDDGTILPLETTDFVKMSLSTSLPVSPDNFALIQEHSLKFMLTGYALRQVAISPKIRTLLLPKLRLACLKLSRKYGYPSALHQPAIDYVLDYLEGRHLLEEDDYLDYYLRRHPNFSQSRLRFALSRLGIDHLPDDSLISEIDKIKTILNKKYAKVDYQDYRAKTRVISALYRQGFSVSDIKSAIDDYAP